MYEYTNFETVSIMQSFIFNIFFIFHIFDFKAKMNLLLYFNRILYELTVFKDVSVYFDKPQSPSIWFLDLFWQFRQRIGNAYFW